MSQVTKSSLEEQMLRAMSLSIYGKHIDSRCRVLSATQRAELQAVAKQEFFEYLPENKAEKSDYQVDASSD
jgi:hypothetical protein